jgi:hypothetical protein
MRNTITEAKCIYPIASTEFCFIASIYQFRNIQKNQEIVSADLSLSEFAQKYSRYLEKFQK